MIISKEHKFVFVAVPKTASTSIHNAWGITKHPPPHEYHMTLEEALKQNVECKDYFKFCFVRNPYQRFISTWFDLISNKNGHLYESWNSLGEEFVSFEQFVFKFPTSKWVNWVHFRKQVDYVKVDGLNKMNFIGRQEKFEEDFAEACRIIGIDKPNTQIVKASIRPRIEEIATKDYYDMISEVYHEDFEQFNYRKFS